MRRQESAASFNSDSAFWNWCYRDEESTRTFTLAFEWLARLAGARIADLTPFSTPHILLDVGCGSGGLAVEYCAQTPSARAVGLDLAAPLLYLSRMADRRRLGNRIEPLVGDMFAIPRSQRFDVVVLSWILHDLLDKQALEVLRQCRAVLSDRGVLIVVETLLGKEPLPYAAMLSTEMYLATGSGRERSLSEYGALLENADLALSAHHDSYDWRSIILAKPTDAALPPQEHGLLFEISQHLDPELVWAVADYGRRTQPAHGDVDLAIILHHQSSLSAALTSLCQLFKSLRALPIIRPVAPTLEWLCILDDSNAEPALHLLTYVDPAVFTRLESDGIVKAILSAAGRRAHDIPAAAPEVMREFDLLQKIANSLVLLLNQQPRHRRIAATAASRIAHYVLRHWPPVASAPKPSAHPLASLDAAISFYEELARRSARST